MSKKKYAEILVGTICSITIWALPIFLSGKFLGEDIFNYSYSGLGIIYPLLFLIWNIAIAIYGKKKKKKNLFASSYLIVLLPIIGYFISFLSYFIITNDSIVLTILYILGIPMATAIYIYDDSAIMTIISGVVILFSPILSIITYKYTKPIAN